MTASFLLALPALLSFLSAVEPSTASNPFESYRWEKRVLIVTWHEPWTDAVMARLFASAERATGDDERPGTVQWVFREQKAIDERDLVVVLAPEFNWWKDKDISNDPVRRYVLRTWPAGPNGVRTLLLGKDGGVKLDRAEIVSWDEIFRRIDSMPMRQQEMQAQQDSAHR
ncbi:MAG: DUF4174 domain-containing protein [Verrucomicrobiae bacterium]|nr:DUF4174 domain-containing protein [Verrucomicrobiae bacterium]